jgi:hypothetical protein
MKNFEKSYILTKEKLSPFFAKRSGLNYMKHVDDGLILLDRMNVADYVKEAFCIHPLLQSDKDLSENFFIVSNTASQKAFGLALEYRNIANSYLSNKTVDVISLSPLSEVNFMLKADKIQNYMDFLNFQDCNKVENWNSLDVYFKRWLSRLTMTLSSFYQEALDLHIKSSWKDKPKVTARLGNGKISWIEQLFITDIFYRNNSSFRGIHNASPSVISLYGGFSFSELSDLGIILKTYEPN